MVKYKINKGEIDNKETDIVKIELSRITFHSRKNSWVFALCVLIKEYYPVQITGTHFYKKQTYYPTIQRFENR